MGFLKDTNMIVDIPRGRIYTKLKSIPPKYVHQITLKNKNFRVYVDMERGETDFNVDMFISLIDVLQEFRELIWYGRMWRLSFTSRRIEARAREFKNMSKAAFHTKEKYENIEKIVRRYWIEVKNFSYSYDDREGKSYLVLPVAFNVNYLYRSFFHLHKGDFPNTLYKYIGKVRIVLRCGEEPYIDSATLFPSTLKDEKNKVALIDPEKYTSISIPYIKLSEFFEFYNGILTKGKKLLMKKYILED